MAHILARHTYEGCESRTLGGGGEAHSNAIPTEALCESECPLGHAPMYVRASWEHEIAISLTGSEACMGETHLASVGWPILDSWEARA